MLSDSFWQGNVKKVGEFRAKKKAGHAARPELWRKSMNQELHKTPRDFGVTTKEILRQVFMSFSPSFMSFSPPPFLKVRRRPVRQPL